MTAEDLEAYPHLKMAQGEDDTGVIVSFNSEAEGITESLVVPADTQALGINPLNWKTDSTPADKSLNLGACFTNYDGEIPSSPGPIWTPTGAPCGSPTWTRRTIPAPSSPTGCIICTTISSSIGTCRRMWPCGRRPIWLPSEARARIPVARPEHRLSPAELVEIGLLQPAGQDLSLGMAEGFRGGQRLPHENPAHPLDGLFHCPHLPVQSYAPGGFSLPGRIQ